MYFPYLRGRQYELLALRELVLKNSLSNKIIPIVEPVKLSSTLIKTLEVFADNQHKIGVICNPEVGTLLKEMEGVDDEKNKNRFLELLSNEFIINCFIADRNLKEMVNSFKENSAFELNECIVICDKHDYVETYLDVFAENIPKYTLIPDEFRRKIRKNKVILGDRFIKKDRNSDYADFIDEFFSEDHLYYSEDGYEGFADYSIIGKDYFDSGFAPYAVAIHIVYFSEDDSLRVMHFVSDTNEDIKNPAKKFYEAVSKLVKWSAEHNNINTIGLDAFIEHHAKQSYPGLGSVKKLSLMHHLELIGNYLDRNK